MARGTWRQVSPTPEFVKLWRETNPDVTPPVAFQDARRLTALVGREPFGDPKDPDMRWHISVRFGDPGRDGRVPSWEEVVRTAHELRPGVVFVLGVPPLSWWMSVHPHVLHLIETRDEPLVESYRANARGDQPT